MSLQRNTAANLAGRVWTAALGLVLIPIYIDLLGMEWYALVGFFATLQSLFLIIDFGLGAAFSREIARLSARDNSAQDQRDLLATLNVLYWLLAAAVALTVWVLAPLIATHWVQPESLSVASLVTSLRLMGVSIAFQLPMGLYQGGLLGLQRQVAFNAVSIVTATIRAAGAIGILLYISSTVEAFFAWQAVVAFLSACAFWLVLARAVPRSPKRATVRYMLLVPMFGYGAGWAANTIGIAVAQQTDKVIVSAMLPLEQFGYYTLASTVAAILWTLVTPVSAAAFPRFNRCVAAGDDAGLADEYDRANQLLAAVLMPAAMVFVFFGGDVMTIWTQKPAVATQIEGLVVCFTVGMTLVGLVNVALHLALSYGWFRLTIAFTWGTAIVSAPLFWLATREWGLMGAAVIWMLQNAAYLLLIPILHRRYVPGGGRSWLKHTLVFPAAAASLVCSASWLVAPPATRPMLLATLLSATWAAATFAVVLVEPALRAQVVALWGQRRATQGSL